VHHSDRPGALDFFDPDGRHIGRTHPRAPITSQYSREQARIRDEEALVRQRLRDVAAGLAA
jgi:hypothetical protein